MTNAESPPGTLVVSGSLHYDVMVEASHRPDKGDVVSTHGAGDVFTGVLCAELVSGTPLQQSREVANESAAAHVAT